jgi:hypothetical protein
MYESSIPRQRQQIVSARHFIVSTFQGGGGQFDRDISVQAMSQV